MTSYNISTGSRLPVLSDPELIRMALLAQLAAEGDTRVSVRRGRRRDRIDPVRTITAGIPVVAQG